jgi:hypothetical protein
MAEKKDKVEKFQEMVRELRKVGANKTCINCGERVRIFFLYRSPAPLAKHVAHVSTS